MPTTSFVRSNNNTPLDSSLLNQFVDILTGQPGAPGVTVTSLQVLTGPLAIPSGSVPNTAISGPNLVVATQGGNNLAISSAASGSAVFITANPASNPSTDPNVPINILPKGAANVVTTGGVQLGDQSNFRSTLYSVTGAPPAGLGSNGDYALRQDTPGTANQTMYVKAGGVWTPLLGFLTAGNTAVSLTLAQLLLGYNGTSQYPHFVVTQHNTTPAGNRLLLYTSDGTQNGVFPTNAVLGLTVENGHVCAAQTTTAQSLATAGTITTAGPEVQRVAPTGAVTGVILQAGTVAGQACTVVNESGFSVTFAASGTSNVADGTSDVIAATTARKFVWDSGTALWYRTA